MKWTDGGGLSGHHNGSGQPVSGTHGPSTTTAPLTSIISIFVDKEFENDNDDGVEEKGKYEGEGRGQGKERSKEYQNSPDIKRSRTQILGGKEEYHENKNICQLNFAILPVVPTY